MLDIQFLGATREVTGSCFLLRAGSSRVLVDCGLVQGGRREEARNREDFPFDPAGIDAVILTHAHLDHSGRLPQLVKAGFRGKIYTHRASRDLCRILLEDAGYLAEKDAQWENSKRQRKGLPLVEPLYTVDDAQAAMHHFRALDYDAEHRVAPGVTVRLRDAGHILGSAVAEVWLEDKGVQRKLVFSGDLGHHGAPILRDPTCIEEADLVVMESTYGDRLHRSWDATWQELKEVIGAAQQEKGNILIPAFAVGRTQELLHIFARHFDEWGLGDWSIFLDSPMAIQATEVYDRHTNLYDAQTEAVHRNNGGAFTLPNLRFSRTTEESMALNQIQSGAIIIAGSGMCTGGRIRHHFKHNIWRRHTHVIIVGFQARGTLGRALVDGAEHIRLWGETMRVSAHIHTIGGLSAHADQQGLVDWYAHFRDRPPVALVHGEEGAMDVLAGRLRNELQAQVLTPGAADQLDLRHMRLDAQAS